MVPAFTPSPSNTPHYAKGAMLPLSSRTRCRPWGRGVCGSACLAVCERVIILDFNETNPEVSSLPLDQWLKQFRAFLLLRGAAQSVWC